MMAGPGVSPRRARLAISFADLALLLLGFFVLLQASGNRSQSVITEVSAQFGAKPVPAASDVRAADLFEAGEAMLTDKGKARISAIASAHSKDKAVLEIASVGLDPGARRFDAWDLAAARLGAVARALAADGIDDRRITIRGLDQVATDGKGQHIRIVPRAAPKA